MRISFRDRRNTHPLIKNPEKIHLRALQMFKTALAVNPSVSLAGNVLSLSIAENSASEITKLSRNAIKQHRYGCMYYRTDRLNNHVPKPTTILAFNLEWIFRRWPLKKETFPTWPPKKQLRGLPNSAIHGSFLREISAHFINAIFPSDDITCDVRTLKDSLSTFKDAYFCGW